MYKDKTISIQLDTLPENPGVYQFYNEKSEILYIGKAKNLKKRIKKGKIKVESTLDLHGYTLAESKKKVANFIFKSHKTNKRLLLIITGKGKKKSSENSWGENLGKLKIVTISTLSF